MYHLFCSTLEKGANSKTLLLPPSSLPYKTNTFCGVTPRTG